MLRKSLMLILTGLFLFGCQQKQTETIKSGRLYFLIGDVQVNGQPAKLNQILHNRDIIKTGEESSAEILLGKQTGVQIRSNSLAVLVIEKDGWEIDTKKGAVLSLVDKGKHYRVKSPSAVAAVRGTIFYTNAYSDSAIYVCTCNGSVDIQFNGETKSVSAAHHQGFSVVKDAENAHLLTSGMKEHTDLEIFDFMYRLDQAQDKNALEKE